MNDSHHIIQVCMYTFELRAYKVILFQSSNFFSPLFLNISFDYYTLSEHCINSFYKHDVSMCVAVDVNMNSIPKLTYLVMAAAATNC